MKELLNKIINLFTLPHVNTQNKSNTAYLTGIRAYAALGVIANHTRLGGLGKFSDFLYNLISHGQHGVSIFFVLSGYTIALSILSKETFSIKEYWKNRFKRILPLYFSLITFLFIIGYHGPWEGLAKNDFVSWLAHISFLNAYFVQYANNIIGVEWTISIEIFFYLFLPYMVFCTKNWGGLAILFLCSVVIMDWGDALPQTITNPDLVSLNDHWRPFKYVWHFTAGVVLASIFYKHKEIKQYFEKEIFTVLFLLSYILCVYFVTGGSQNLYLVITCILITISSSTNKITKFLFENNVAIYLGTISFSLYMLHFPLRFLFEDLFGKLSITNFTYYLYFVVLILLCNLSYKFIEYPFMQKKSLKEYYRSIL